MQRISPALAVHDLDQTHRGSLCFMCRRSSVAFGKVFLSHQLTMVVGEQTPWCRVIDPLEAMGSRPRRNALRHTALKFSFILLLQVFSYESFWSVAHALPETAVYGGPTVGVAAATEDVPPSLVDLHLLLNDVRDVEREESLKGKDAALVTKELIPIAPAEGPGGSVDASVLPLDSRKSLPTSPQNIKEVAVIGVAAAVLGYLNATKTPETADVKQPFKNALKAFLGVLTDLELWNSLLPKRFKGPIVAFTNTKKAFDKATNRRGRNVTSPPPWEGLLLLLSLPLLVLVLGAFVISLFIASVVAAAVAGAVVLTGLFAVTLGSALLVVGLLVTALYWLVTSAYRIFTYKLKRGAKEQGAEKGSPS